MGLARVPDSPAVAVTVPPTPAVSRSSSAYKPTSGNPSSWRCASARPRVGRAPSSTSLPDPYALRSASPVTVAAESVTVSSVGRSSTQTSPGRWTASESTPTASAALPVWAAWRANRPPARNAPPSPKRERRGGTRLPGEVAPAGRDPPGPPREPLDAGTGIQAERVEGALEREEQARGAGQPRVARVRSARVVECVGGATREPADERVERVEAVGVEVERQLPSGSAPPPEGAGPRGHETRLHNAQRVHIQPPVGEPHVHGTRVHGGAGELRWLDDRLHRAEGRRRAVAHEIPSQREPQARRRSPASQPVRQVEVVDRDLQVARAVVRKVEYQGSVAAHRAASGAQIQVRLERAQRAREPHGPRHGAKQRQRREGAPEVVERQRV